tara:strand:+ start:10864 stop:11616 length:753 start_codon:yes stop_codon:yes gene_type:complete
MQAIKAPEVCHTCGYPLVWEVDLLYCQNKSCSAQVSKKIEHFAKTLKIKGLGPKTIEKLDLTNLHEVYCLDEEWISHALKSEKLAKSLMEQIDLSKAMPLNMVLPSFSIPLIGSSATEKLSKVIDTIYEITEDKCKEAGLGPTATENLMLWYETEFCENLYHLPFDFKFEKVARIKVGTEIVCISGKLSSFKTKAEATAALVAKGYHVNPNLTRNVDILVNESGIESAKTKKARESGITIVTNLSEFLGD